MAREKPACQDVIAFVKWHAGKRAFAPCTGQDYAALEAFAHLVRLWCRSDDNGRRRARAAMSACLGAMQGKVHHLAKWMIPGIGDWGFVDQIWPHLEGYDPYDLTIDAAGTIAASNQTDTARP